MKKTFTLIVTLLLLISQPLQAQEIEFTNNYKEPLDFINLLLHPDNSDAKLRAKAKVSALIESTCTNVIPTPPAFEFLYDSARGTVYKSYNWQMPAFTTILTPVEPYKYQQTEDTFYCNDSNQISYEYNLFDDRGRLAYLARYQTRYNYTYDKKGKVTALAINMPVKYYGDEAMIELFMMTYDKQGILSNVNYKGNHHKKVFYNKDSALLTVTEYDLRYSYDTSYIVSHDYYLENNRLKKYRQTDLNSDYQNNGIGFYHTIEIEYEYNKAGLLVNTVERSNIYAHVVKNIFKYDKYHNPVVYGWNLTNEDGAMVFATDSITYHYGKANRIETIDRTRFYNFDFSVDTFTNYNSHNYTVQHYYHPNGLLRKRVEIDGDYYGPTIITSYKYE